ncbi:hypothetical protein [Moorella sp. E306M]|uniref:hypothetical protein n=1 Tax=Moorella sp. E306M TaxID=2572683 RepID=UPI0010FFC346|nr:hypothetical protein [Moorella sp. E306M]GEA17534.1 hypothetical protein E306M_06680 [Moorella sp. E306M]
MEANTSKLKIELELDTTQAEQAIARLEERLRRLYEVVAALEGRVPEQPKTNLIINMDATMDEEVARKLTDKLKAALKSF